MTSWKGVSAWFLFLEENLFLSKFFLLFVEKVIWTASKLRGRGAN